MFPEDQYKSYLYDKLVSYKSYVYAKYVSYKSYFSY